MFYNIRKKIKNRFADKDDSTYPYRKYFIEYTGTMQIGMIIENQTQKSLIHITNLQSFEIPGIDLYLHIFT